jgi:hypothetical protein
MQKYRPIVFMMSLICVVRALSAAWGGSTAVSQKIDPEMLLDKYNSCNKKFETIYYELETTLQVGGDKCVYSLKHCSNKEKKQWIGDLKRYKKDGIINQKSSTLIVKIVDDKMGIALNHYNPELKGNLPPRAVIFRGSREKFLQGINENSLYDGSLKGGLDGSNHKSIYDLLKGASNLKLHNESTKMIGYDTYLIEADTKYGIVKAWISPDLDYNCLRWEIIKKQDQFYRDGAITNDRFTKRTDVFIAEKVVQIDGKYIVTQAKLDNKVENGDTILGDYTYHYNLKNIDLSPDYEALGAFEIQLPEGTMATHEEVPGIKFIWTKGKFVPDVNDYLYKYLTGNPLSELKDLGVNLSPADVNDKSILVCFFDMEQRPSRNCIQELSKKAEELKQKGIVVIAAQASKIEQEKLDEWVKESEVTFLVGIIEGDSEKTRFDWGVKSLPWLILTDKNHIVRSQGFSLDELDEKLKR